MSIATCGHKVFDGISCTTILDEETLSYGTYCADCIKIYHKEERLEPDTEIKKILDENEKLIEDVKFLLPYFNDCDDLCSFARHSSACKRRGEKAKEILARLNGEKK